MSHKVTDIAVQQKKLGHKGDETFSSCLLNMMKEYDNTHTKGMLEKIPLRNIW